MYYFPEDFRQMGHSEKSNVTKMHALYIFNKMHVLDFKSIKVLLKLQKCYFFLSCSSYLGRIGKAQPITLARRCWTRGVVAHEIGTVF